jgi:hypothetical protein
VQNFLGFEAATDSLTLVSDALMKRSFVYGQMALIGKSSITLIAFNAFSVVYGAHVSSQSRRRDKRSQTKAFVTALQMFDLLMLL